MSPVSSYICADVVLWHPCRSKRGRNLCRGSRRKAVVELKNWLHQMTGAIPLKMVRISVGRMPWGRLRSLSEVFAENQTSVGGFNLIA
jgi:hypothetical protein